jgi:hypothetical protein
MRKAAILLNIIRERGNLLESLVTRKLSCGVRRGVVGKVIEIQLTRWPPTLHQVRFCERLGVKFSLPTRLRNVMAHFKKVLRHLELGLKDIRNFRFLE